MRPSYLFRQNSWVYIKKCETEISIKRYFPYPSIKCTQFLLTLAWTSAVHNVQDFSLGQSIIDFDLQVQKSSGPRQNIYCTQWVKTYIICMHRGI